MSARSSDTTVAHATASMTVQEQPQALTTDPEKNIPAPTSATEWNGVDDVDDPLTWGKWKRVYHIYPPALISFTSWVDSSYTHQFSR